MKKGILGICAALVICSAGLASAETLIGPITAERNGADLKINGRIQKIPVGTKIWVSIIHIIHEPGGKLKQGSGPAGPQDSHVIVAEDGTFHASLHNTWWDSKSRSDVDYGTFRPGSYAVMIYACFNSAWQTIDVLRKAGVELDSRGRSAVSTDPKAIPESPDFKPYDPEFPKAGRKLAAIREVKLAPITADQAAIDAVKGATLDVKGSGRSSMPVGQSLDWYKSMGGMTRLAWSAARGPDARWVVTLDFLEGEDIDQKQRKAQWSYDPASNTVRYLDPLSKTLSYVPAE
jgi:hypothetical protein